MKYTLQAGRSILKDDLPFVHLVRSTVHSQGDHAFTPTEADAFAREVVAACNAAPILAQVIKDAIEMLRWQARKPVGADSWAQWVVDAMTALEAAQPQYLHPQREQQRRALAAITPEEIAYWETP